MPYGFRPGLSLFVVGGCHGADAGATHVPGLVRIGGDPRDAVDPTPRKTRWHMNKPTPTPGTRKGATNPASAAWGFSFARTRWGSGPRRSGGKTHCLATRGRSGGSPTRVPRLERRLVFRSVRPFCSQPHCGERRLDWAGRLQGDPVLGRRIAERQQCLSPVRPNDGESRALQRVLSRRAHAWRIVSDMPVVSTLC